MAGQTLDGVTRWTLVFSTHGLRNTLRGCGPQRAGDGLGVPRGRSGRKEVATKAAERGEGFGGATAGLEWGDKEERTRAGAFCKDQGGTARLASSSKRSEALQHWRHDRGSPPTVNPASTATAYPLRWWFCCCHDCSRERGENVWEQEGAREATAQEAEDTYSGSGSGGRYTLAPWWAWATAQALPTARLSSLNFTPHTTGRRRRGDAPKECHNLAGCSENTYACTHEYGDTHNLLQQQATSHAHAHGGGRVCGG